MAARSWEDVELPILEEVVAAHQGGQEAPDTDALAERTGLDEGRVVGAVRTLLLSEHLEAIDASAMDGEHYMRIRPLKPALQATGAWPSQDPFDELIRVLEERAAQSDDPDEAAKLRGWRGHLLDVGKGTASGVLTAAMRAAIGVA